MKEIIIRIKIDNDKLATLIKTNGFDDNAEKVFTILGILDNLKNQQLKKLDNLKFEDG